MFEFVAMHEKKITPQKNPSFPAELAKPFSACARKTSPGTTAAAARHALFLRDRLHFIGGGHGYTPSSTQASAYIDTTSTSPCGLTSGV